MEEKSNNRQLDIILNNVFTLDKSDKLMTRLGSKDVFLHKNGHPCRCPFLSTIGSAGNGQYGLMEAPCGTPCHHFHIFPDTRKVLEPESDGSDKKVERLVKTGKVRVALTCGNASAVYPIANIKLNEQSSSDNAGNGNLKVTKTVESGQQ